jgi:hypothetical protein
MGEGLIVSGLVVQPLGYDPALTALGIDQSAHYRLQAGFDFKAEGRQTYA